ncbi:MAG: hypothetical protein MN733_39605 [Nitrososphaera sp.]|nr:hypothetical protein [Nitrososphaera sp.]
MIGQGGRLDLAVSPRRPAWAMLAQWSWDLSYRFHAVPRMNQPLPLVRFQFLVQKAAEICQEVKSLGNNLLSAIEKEDNEARRAKESY